MFYIFRTTRSYFKGVKPDFDTALINGLFGFVVYLLLNGYFLKTYGQTIGKKLLSIRIASKDGAVPHVKQSIGLRFVPLYVCTLIPILNVLLVIDPLFIFRKDRKCLHDLVAGTQVVKA
ncbi:RDD family protein [Microbulbifer taiwanensis]|uniref:RDD family protein n=1 Tax=Microbulbifer taiwanensis TaxID=986746 RepID=UPI00360B6C93